MNDDKYIHRIRARFRQGTDELDAATLSRLNHARQHALAQMDHPRYAPAWLPAGAIAVLSAMAVTVWLWTGSPDYAAAPVAHNAQDLELLLSGEELELIANLDFYLWLQKQDHAS